KVYNRCGLVPNIYPPNSVSEEKSFQTLKSCTVPNFTSCVVNVVAGTLITNWDAIAGATRFFFKYRKFNDLDWSAEFEVAAVDHTKTINTGIVSSLYEVSVRTNYDDYRSCEAATICSIPKVLNVKRSVYNNFTDISWDKINGVDFYLVTVVSLEGTCSAKYITPYAKLKLTPNTNYQITVQAFYNTVPGIVSHILNFNSGPEIYVDPDDNCEAPLIESFFQDSNINDPSIPVNTKNDISVILKDYDNSLKYIVEIFLEGESVPVESQVVDPNVSEFEEMV